MFEFDDNFFRNEFFSFKSFKQNLGKFLVKTVDVAQETYYDTQKRYEQGTLKDDIQNNMVQLSIKSIEGIKKGIQTVKEFIDEDVDQQVQQQEALVEKQQNSQNEARDLSWKLKTKQGIFSFSRSINQKIKEADISTKLNFVKEKFQQTEISEQIQKYSLKAQEKIEQSGLQEKLKVCSQDVIKKGKIIGEISMELPKEAYQKYKARNQEKENQL